MASILYKNFQINLLYMTIVFDVSYTEVCSRRFNYQ